MRVLNLVIASDNEPYYEWFVRQWRSYMHMHPSIDSYFVWMRSNHHDGERTVQIDGDSIVVDGEEGGGIPSIFDKTILAMEYVLSRQVYDYVLRTNLSSFFVWHRLVSFLKGCPRTNFVVGHLVQGAYPSGCGFVMSVDVAKICLSSSLCGQKYRQADDAVFGCIFREHGVDMMHRPYAEFGGEFSMHTIQTFQKTYLDHLPTDVFHIRIRSGREWYRDRVEPILYARCVRHFYIGSSSS